MKEFKFFFLLTETDASRVWKVNKKIEKAGIDFRHGNYANMHCWGNFQSETSLELAKKIIREAFPNARESL
jgi:hypothetical protein